MSSLWTHGLVWLICGLLINCEFATGVNAASKKDCYRKTCASTEYDIREAVCCENRLHPGAGLSCCGKKVFNPASATCCEVHGNTTTAYITHGISNKESACCGLKAYNPLNEICCQSTIKAKPAPKTRCCGEVALDADKQLCCGPNKMILTRNSSDDQCCGHDLYNTKTECCCLENITSLKRKPINSNCCLQNAGVPSQHPSSQPKCTEHQHLCGSSCYNPNELLCCRRNQKPHWCCAGQCDAVPTVYNPRTQVCCDGCVSDGKPWIDQCCGETPYGLAQRGVLCCNDTLYKDREDGEGCSEAGVPYNPAKGTICCSQFHDSPGQHCCGKEVYQLDTEICCDGHRHSKKINLTCCGIKAYDIKDPQMKCCAGTLYNLTSIGKLGHGEQCCGSVLHNSSSVCCRSEDKEVLYSIETGFKCCGHLYYNSFLWSCCAGKLSPVHHPGQHQNMMINGYRLLSLNNLKETDLCKEIHIGTVESVSLDGVIFRNVLKIHGRNGTVKPLAAPYILEISDRCNSPKLIPGKTYFFHDVNVFADFNHHYELQSLYFIFSKCYKK